MTIYTKTGDRGETDLLGGDRVTKDHARLEVCGTIDELNCHLGLARCEPLPEAISALLEQIQHQLFDVGSQLAAVEEIASVSNKIRAEDVAAFEQVIDRYQATLPPLKWFVLPAGSRGAVTLHVARAVCRRAERRMVALMRHEPEAVSAELIAYVNRLSDLLFVLARAVNHEGGVSDTHVHRPAEFGGLC